MILFLKDFGQNIFHFGQKDENDTILGAKS